MCQKEQQHDQRAIKLVLTIVVHILVLFFSRKYSIKWTNNRLQERIVNMTGFMRECKM